MIESIKHVHAMVPRQFQNALDEIANEAKAKDCEVEIPHYITGDRSYSAIVILRRPDDAGMLVR